MIAAFFFWVPWTVKPITDFRSATAQAPQVAQETFLSYSAGQRTKVTSSRLTTFASFQNSGATTVTTGADVSCLYRIASFGLLAETLTVNPRSLHSSTMDLLCGIPMLW